MWDEKSSGSPTVRFLGHSLVNSSKGVAVRFWGHSSEKGKTWGLRVKSSGGLSEVLGHGYGKEKHAKEFPLGLKRDFTSMTTFPYQYAPMPTTHTALPGIDEPLTTTTTTNKTTDITSNVSNLIDSVKNFDVTTLMMIGGSIIMLFIIFK